jgi:phosphoglycerol transferase MdoB-like AlkP superfamily enzyme
MVDAPIPISVRLRQSRYGFALFYLLTLLLGWAALRLVFLLAFRSPASPSQIIGVVATGAFRDVYFGLVEIVPLLLWLAVIRESFFRKAVHKNIFFGIFFIVVFLQIFLLFVEFFFFEEFKSRFNTVAVDYLIYPQEVFVNIWESYHVGWILLLCVFLAALWIWAARQLFAPMWLNAIGARSKWGALAVVCLAIAATTPLVALKGTHVGNNRTLNEIANNGGLSFVYAARTRHLDYAAFYKTLPSAEAYSRARRLLSIPGSSYAETGDSILRNVAGDTNRPRLNVVILLQESLGSEFWGCLGRTNTLTPRMDQLATEEGILFTNIYASGNRTVRGMEGVLSSFPPLPGDSIVKRNLSDNVETIARILKRDGYATEFIYGGRGFFDGMRSFAVRNGYDRFIEQKDFVHPTFKTIWGVCDDDLMRRSVEELKTLNDAGKPFFATVLSVSNHKPYTFPKGRIPENPDRKKREFAVKYADFALGEFFALARKEAFWTNTVFAVVADHGARVYGSQSIPIASYEIPLVVLGPAAVGRAQRVGVLGCSLDVAPTLLGLVGRPYQTLFFGRDLLRIPANEGRAFLNHNRDIGMLFNDRLAVLGLMQTAEFYTGNPKQVNMVTLKTPQANDLEIEKDATAIFQVADDLYTHQRFQLDQETSGITH